MRNVIIILSFLFSITAFSQELNCEVVVNARQTGNENLPVFKTLEKQLKEFINKTKWTNKEYAAQERINCSMVLNITEYNSDVFVASLQIQSSRPVFNSTYTTPIYNFKDSDVTFRYIEFQDLIFNKNQFESNLVSVLAFHVYMVLGLDAESFAKNGGEAHFSQAQTIVNFSQQENFKGWKLSDGRQTRFTLITSLLSPTYKEYREVIYDYHFGALDNMHNNQKKAKENVSSALQQFIALNSRRPNSFLLRVFFDAKADEIEQIFSGGPSVNITETIETLNKVAPMHASKWRNIKF